jgi:hypothetical protein
MEGENSGGCCVGVHPSGPISTNNLFIKCFFIRPVLPSVVLTLSKSVFKSLSNFTWQSKKRVHLQQFGIIHLPNSDLTYIRNLKRNKIMFMPFRLLETYIRNPSLFFISFFTLPPRGKRRWQPRSARAYMRMGRWVLPSFYFCQVGLPNCWRPIFLVLSKLDGCQVDLPNCWSYSKKVKKTARRRWWWALSSVGTKNT